MADPPIIQGNEAQLTGRAKHGPGLPGGRTAGSVVRKLSLPQSRAVQQQGRRTSPVGWALGDPACQLQHRAICLGRSPPIMPKMRWNRSRGTATSAIWNTVSGRGRSPMRRSSPPSPEAWSTTTAPPPPARRGCERNSRDCTPAHEAGGGPRWPAWTGTTGASTGSRSCPL